MLTTVFLFMAVMAVILLFHTEAETRAAKDLLTKRMVEVGLSVPWGASGRTSGGRIIRRCKMRLSDLEAIIRTVREKEGDIEIFTGGMQPVVKADLEVVEALEPEKYGKRYMHFGEW
jgi:hypothetical protein